MDKQLIELIALEVAEAMPEGFLWSEGCGYEVGVVKSEVRNFAHAFLARIDAERGKEAKGFLIEGPRKYQDVTQRQEVIDRARDLGYVVSPLVLSPTIPEGMLLVKEAAVREIIDRCVAPDMYDPARRMLDDLITAQGEK